MDERARDLWLSKEEWGLVVFLARHYAGDEEEFLDNLQEACLALFKEKVRVCLLFEARSRHNYIDTVVKNRLLNVRAYRSERLKKAEPYDDSIEEVDREDVSFRARVQVLLSGLSAIELEVVKSVCNAERKGVACKRLGIDRGVFDEILLGVQEKARMLGLDPEENEENGN